MQYPNPMYDCNMYPDCSMYPDYSMYPMMDYSMYRMICEMYYMMKQMDRRTYEMYMAYMKKKY